MANPDGPGTTITDHEVVDDQLTKLGKVTDVIYDDSPDARPRWATVKMHAVGRERVAPLAGSYLSEDGRLVLPYDRSTLKHAPTAPPDHVLSRELEAELASYYHLTDA